jgi:acetylornithine deacetylase
MNGLAERAIKHLRKLVGFDTISRKSNRALQDWAAERLEGLGASLRWTFDDSGQKANLLATFGPRDAEGGMILSGHTDVVDVAGQKWTSDPFELTERDGRLFGRGACDMKGFLACSLAVIESLELASLRRPIHLAWSYDEEVGCLGAPRMIADLARNMPPPAFCIVGEPTLMRLVTAHNGSHSFDITVTGKEAHSSRPAQGANAVLAAAEFITWARRYFDDLARRQQSAIPSLDPPVTTFNIGQIEGGTAHNIVPRHCRFGFGFRPIPEADVARIEADVRHQIETVIAPMVAHEGAETGVRIRDRAVVPPLAPALNRDLRAYLSKRFGLEGDDAVPFGTEAGQFQEVGIPTLVCGPGSIDQAHQADEFIAISEIERAVAFLSRLCATARD